MNRDLAEPYDIEKEIELKLRLAERDVVRFRAMLEAYRAASVEDVGFWQGLRLDGMFIKDALVKLLEYAASRGRESVRLEEAGAVLKNFRVRTSRRSGYKPVSDIKKPHVALLRIIRARENQALFELNNSEPRAQDFTIRLAKGKQKV